MTSPWAATAGGGRYHLLAPDPAQVHITEIAWALGNLCRFNGHTRCFYSVAQHSVLVSELVGPEHRLWGLLHDAHEAYVGDNIWPLKAAVPELARVEEPAKRAVAAAFGLPWPEPEEVKRADLLMLATEARLFMPPPAPEGWDLPVEPLDMEIVPLPPEEAAALFLVRFRELFHAC
jgi:hypothetical protein